MPVPDSAQNQLTTTTTQPPGDARRRRPGLILAFLCAAGFMTFLDVSIVNVALPTIEHDLNISESYLQYVVTTYGILLGGFLLLGGRLADTVGRRRILRAGLLLFGAASLMAGLSSGVVALIVARGLQGLGAAFIAPSALSLVTSNFAEGPERNKALGLWGALGGLAAIFGVILGGLLTEGPGWRWIFFVNVPIGVVLAAVTPLIVAESRSEQRGKTFDVAGAVTLTAGLVLLIYTLGQTADAGWASARTIASLGGRGHHRVAVADDASRGATRPGRPRRMTGSAVIQRKASSRWLAHRPKVRPGRPAMRVTEFSAHTGAGGASASSPAAPRAPAQA